jgi:branched-chain amino acid aminotransferase
MASAFTLAVNPWVYIAQYQDNGTWSETYTEKPHRTPEEEAAMGNEEHDQLLAQRNSFPELPLVNYTSQYGLGCFEGLKAFPQPDGSLKMFRPDQNGNRMSRSMEGLMMPAFPAEKFVEAVGTVVAKNANLGFRPAYDPEWEKDGFMRASAVYIRPFTWAESGIGVNLSKNPHVVVVTTQVGSYFDPDASTAAVTTRRVRANPGGTGWIKCDANYVTSTLAKKEAQAEGYMESIFLDALEHTYLEEGSSSNIFILLKDGTLVTPDLRDTILPGITRSSVVTLAKEWGIAVEERQISIDEAQADGAECFVSGTAAGVTPVESITHGGRTAVFNNRKIGDLTVKLRDTLKGIQYGAIEDTHGWMYTVPIGEAQSV